MQKSTRAELDQALTYLNLQYQHLRAAGAHHGCNQELSDDLLSCVIESGALADRLRGDLTWDEVMEIMHGGER